MKNQFIIPDSQRLFPTDQPVGVFINGRTVDIENVEQALAYRFGEPFIAQGTIITTIHDAQDVIAIFAVSGPKDVALGILTNLEIPTREGNDA